MGGPPSPPRFSQCGARDRTLKSCHNVHPTCRAASAWQRSSARQPWGVPVQGIGHHNVSVMSGLLDLDTSFHCTMILSAHRLSRMQTLCICEHSVVVNVFASSTSLRSKHLNRPTLSRWCTPLLLHSMTLGLCALCLPYIEKGGFVHPYWAHY